MICVTTGISKKAGYCKPKVAEPIMFCGDKETDSRTVRMGWVKITKKHWE